MTVEAPDPIDFYPPASQYPTASWPPPPGEVHGSYFSPQAPEPKKKRSPWVYAIPAFILALLVGGLFSVGNSADKTSASSSTTVAAVSTTTAGRPATTPTTASASTAKPATPPSTTRANVPTTAAGAGKLVGTPLDIHAVIAKVGPSVVSIEITQRGQPVSAGSGVVISNDGLVVTNAHVVDLNDQFGRPMRNATISIRLADGTERPATVLGTSRANDLAVVKVEDATGLVAATIGDSDQLQVGDDVVAIGNALDLGATPTVTRGIISAKGRSLKVDANIELTGLLQTDAAINHGNSGGALVNASGHVIGINSAGIPDAQNLGFAIASNTFLPLIDQLKSGQTPAVAPAAVLGVTTQLSGDGVVVTGVSPASGAEGAGIQPGDLITALDGKAVTTQDQLGSAIRSHKPGETITITFDRGGAMQTVKATLGAR